MSENRSGFLAAFLIFIVAAYNLIIVAVVVSAGGGVSVTFGILATILSASVLLYALPALISWCTCKKCCNSQAVNDFWYGPPIASAYGMLITWLF